MNNFNRLFPKDKPVIAGFPSFLQVQVFRWIKQHIVNHTPRPQVHNYSYTVLKDSFNAQISSEFQQDLGKNLEEHFASISGDREMIAEYVNYLLQSYTDEQSAVLLETILKAANSEFSVNIRRIDLDPPPLTEPTSHIPPKYKILTNLEFRAVETAKKQLDAADNERLKDAWDDFYNISNQNLNGVTQKSLDAVAGAIRDRLYKNDQKTNLSDYARRIERDISILDLPNKEKIDWVSIIRSLANHVDARGVHNSGTDADATEDQAHTVLHTSIAVIAMLKG